MCPEAQLLLRQAQVLGDQQQYERAVPLLRQAASMEPDSSQILWALSFSLRMVGRIGEAVDYGRRLVAMGPVAGESHALLAGMLIAESRFHEAIAAGEEAVRLNPANANNYWAIVSGSYELGRYDQAVEVCRHALGLCPDHFELRLHFGIVLAAAGQGLEANEVIVSNLRDFAGRWYCQVCTGWAFWHLEQYERAAFFFLEALRLNPRFPWQHEGMAFVRYAQGRREESLQHFRDCNQGKFVWADVRRSMRQLKRHLCEAESRRQTTGKAPTK